MAEPESVRHMGPMAQDFHAAFGLGHDDKTISMLDAQGVALAAIQGLNARVEEQRRELAELRERVTAAESLRGELAALRAELADLRETRTQITARAPAAGWLSSRCSSLIIATSASLRHKAKPDPSDCYPETSILGNSDRLWPCCSKAVARECPNARDHRSAKAGEARCSGSGASTGWASSLDHVRAGYFPRVWQSARTRCWGAHRRDRLPARVAHQ